MSTHQRRRFTWLVAAAAALAAAGAVAAAPTAGAERALTPHERAVAFWTNERVAKAKPRDMTRHAQGAPVVPMAKGGKGGSGTGTSVAGASWTGGGEVATATGKVLFSIGGSYYVCSASVVEENVNNASVILTAAHCVYDEQGGFASNWVFIPDYDSAPVALDRNGSFCASTRHGCWTATRIVVAREYYETPGFPVDYDYAFVRVGLGGLNDTELDELPGSDGHPIVFGAQSGSPDTFLFGYPAARPYNGTDLIYSRGPLGRDPYNANNTYKVNSNMTGGCSGGPWFVNFSTVLGNGTLMSVNSYGYSGVKALHGPILNNQTKRMFDEALLAGSSTKVVD